MHLLHPLRLLIIISTMIMLAACSSETSTAAKNPIAVPTKIYQVSDNVISSDSSSNQLYAIDQKLNSGAYDIAQQQLAQLTLSSLGNPALTTNIIILQAKLQLLTGHPQQALTWLNQFNTSTALNATQQNYVMQLRSQALYRTNYVLPSAIVDMQDQSNTTIIWNKLLLIDPNVLLEQQATETETLIAGWLQLAVVAEQNANHFMILKKYLLIWRQAYPNHPANSLFSVDSAVDPLDDETATKSIAVILPLSGAYANFGHEIQQGILSAYYKSPSIEQQHIEFYDSNADSISSIYRRIKAQKCDIILGPLTKEDTENLLDIAEEFPPIISLNYVNKKIPNSHLEFGLSPEDEAKQIAELAWRQGKSSAIIITTKTDKGQQTANTFAQTWSNLGGQVVDRYNYLNSDDFSTSIATVLGVTDSKVRQNILHDTLHLNVNNTPYFRKDADMVFLVADAKIAQKIRPFIKFYAGDYLSVFTTSSAYNGHTDIKSDKDLNDVYFCDMPAILRSDTPQDRLYFVGQDAYLLAMQQAHLNTLPRFPLLGSTGSLTVNTMKHSIQRELTCAQFKDGRATPLETPSKRSSD